MANHLDGIRGVQLPQLYLQSYGVKLPYKDLGYDKLKNFLTDKCAEFVEIDEEETPYWIKPIKLFIGKNLVWTITCMIVLGMRSLYSASSTFCCPYLVDALAMIFWTSL